MVIIFCDAQCNNVFVFASNMLKQEMKHKGGSGQPNYDQSK